MKKQSFKGVVWFFLICQIILLALPVSAAVSTTDLSISNYQLTARKRVSRTDYEYTPDFDTFSQTKKRTLLFFNNLQHIFSKIEM